MEEGRKREHRNTFSEAWNWGGGSGPGSEVGQEGHRDPV